MSEMVHAMVTWSPRPELDPDAPRGLQLWAEILDNFQTQGDLCHCWWGKVSRSGNLGMTENDINLLNRQIEHEKGSDQKETHLYMFCPIQYWEQPVFTLGWSLKSEEKTTD